MILHDLDNVPFGTGSFGVVRLGGWAGNGIRLGEYLIDGHNDYSHAFVVIDKVSLRDGWDWTIVEAEPNGARLAKLSQYVGCQVAFNAAPEQSLAIKKEALDLVGVPYNWLDYAALAMARFGVHPAPVQKRLAREDRLMCSQLVDVAYRRAGNQLFNDGRFSGNVTPGDLGWLAEHQ